MKRVDADIDIDVPDREKALSSLGKYVQASQINGNIIKPHNVGVYLQDIPEYLKSGMASIDYKDAPNYGFFKIDILTNNVYKEVNTEEELDILLEAEPDWDLLLDENVVTKLAQIHQHYRRLCQWKPRTTLQLAMFIAMIRPSKAYLLESKSWGEVEGEIWLEPKDGSPYFKKSHAIAYASTIIIQMNLIRLGRL